jgi:hypothetical protein
VDQQPEEGGQGGTPLDDLKTWARCVAGGVPDELYWDCTPAELDALLDELEEREARREAAAHRRTATLLAAIYNASGRFRRWYRPDDFLKPGKAIAPLSEADVQDILKMALSTEPRRSVRA